MKNKIFSLVGLFMILMTACDQEMKTGKETKDIIKLDKAVLKLSVVAAGAQVQELAGGFSFTEGPAVDKDGNVFFTDIPNNRIYKWSVMGRQSVYKVNSGGANGIFFDASGNLVTCLGGNRMVISIDSKGNMRVLANEYENRPLNSPNDLWIDPKGGIYFTDPRYGRRDAMEQDGEHVYYILPDGENIIRVVDDMVRPNGIIGTPDGKRLYIADHGANKTYVYNIRRDGRLANKKLFANEGSDGMTIDNEGNVYLTTDAVKVYNRNGTLREIISVPEQPSNVCFGGQKRDTLFITARTSLYSVKMRTRGVY